jgi:hypothetical protein
MIKLDAAWSPSVSRTVFNAFAWCRVPGLLGGRLVTKDHTPGGGFVCHQTVFNRATGYRGVEGWSLGPMDGPCAMAHRRGSERLRGGPGEGSALAP